jgi:hypothetical protein
MTRGIAPDLTGFKSGNLTVIRRVESDKGSNAVWLCSCACGNQVEVRAMYIKNGKQKFCSKQCPLYTEPMRIDYTGKKFGRLTAIAYERSSPGGEAIWSYRCDCGNITELKHYAVKTGHVQSCGCLGKESRIKHGKSHTLEYHREAHRKWAKANPEKVIANALRRTKAKRLRIPAWLTDKHWDQIAILYKEAQRLTVETGVVHHVDHIYPLRGKTCSGLHVPWNLRVLPSLENLRKANKLPDDIC